MVLLALLVSTFSFLSQCSSTSTTEETVFLNHHDSVAYVGMASCAACHQDKYQSFSRTGMGRSFGMATTERSSAVFGPEHVVHDSSTGLSYYPYIKADELYIMEFRLEQGDTVHQLSVRVDYIVGSGQHTNSHLFQSEGYVYQAPLTYYTQEGRWDLPPGFENGNNSRFSRLIDLECMSCHNAMPTMETNSSRRFENIGHGIDCERCHGPGELHVMGRSRGTIDSNGRDLTIVNPAKLSLDRQIDICQRCHLQGLNVLKEGKSFDDFRPGMRLADVFNVFLPEYGGQQGRLDMANHADRFQRSKCFTASSDNTFGCISCHNPHVSVKETKTEQFNAVCQNCHAAKRDSIHLSQSNCVQCHMPETKTADIQHVRIHDHRIQVPLAREQRQEIKTLIGLYAVNNDAVEQGEMIRAYLEYWEKFDKNPIYLEKALTLLQAHGTDLLWMKYHYLKNAYEQVVHYGRRVDALDPWSAYMLGQSYLNLDDLEKAETYLGMSYRLDKDQVEVAVKLVQLYVNRNQFGKAGRILDEVILAFPNNAEVLRLQAVRYTRDAQFGKAEELLAKALRWAPDSLSVWEAFFNLHISQGNADGAKYWGERILKTYPNYPQAEKLKGLIKNMA